MELTKYKFLNRPTNVTKNQIGESYVIVKQLKSNGGCEYWFAKMIYHRLYELYYNNLYHDAKTSNVPRAWVGLNEKSIYHNMAFKRCRWEYQQSLFKSINMPIPLIDFQHEYCFITNEFTVCDSQKCDGCIWDCYDKRFDKRYVTPMDFPEHVRNRPDFKLL